MPNSDVGVRTWTFEFSRSSPVTAGGKLAELDLATTILCTPAIAHGALYLRSDGKLWKLK